MWRGSAAQAQPHIEQMILKDYKMISLEKRLLIKAEGTLHEYTSAVTASMLIQTVYSRHFSFFKAAQRTNL